MLVMATLMSCAEVTCGEGTLLVDGSCVPMEGSDDDDSDDTAATGDDTAASGDDTAATADDSGEVGEDSDGDGFSPPEDCDDDDPAVNPGAEETCDNGVDDNCNGSLDGCGSWEGSGQVSEFGDAILGSYDNGRLGWEMEIGDVDGDGLMDLVAGAPASSRVAEYSGHLDLFLGPLEGGVESEHVDGAVLGQDKNAWAGRAIALGDYDGDGDDDIAFGLPESHFRSTPMGPGGVAVFLSPPLGNEAPADAAGLWEGGSDGTGHSLGTVPDTNGDGLDELVIGAWGDSTLTQYSGAAFIVYGPATAGGRLDGADARFYGGQSGPGAGSGKLLGGSALGGDFNGDGVGDVVVGAYGHADSEAGEYGAAYIWFGPLQGSSSYEDPDGMLYMPWSYAAPPGQDNREMDIADVDQDGLDDLVLGSALFNGGLGAAFIIHGDSIGGRLAIPLADARIDGVYTDERLGTGVRSGEDLDGDGQIDVIVGAYNHSEFFSAAGRVYLLAGPFSGVSSVDDAILDVGGREKSDGLGYSMAVGDVNGDGPPDLLINAVFGEDGTGSSGSIWLLTAEGI